MKLFILIATLFALNSCNTCIGLYRDSKVAFTWTKEKMQGSGGGGNQDVAPVY